MKFMFFIKLNLNHISYESKIIFELNICGEILEQMERCVCKIKIENKQAIGFFCRISIPNKNKTLFILITNNKVINKKMLKKKDFKISIEIKKEKELKELNLNNRKIYK